MRNYVPRLLAVAAVLAAVGCASTSGEAAPPAYAPHTMNVLIGGSFDRGGDGPALGGTYEYRKRGKVGFGGFADVAFGNDTSTVVGGAVFVRPEERWGLMAGPGVEFINGNTNVLARIGGWYEFPMDEFTISPIGWIDLDSDDVSFFIGVALGLRF